MGVKEAAPFVKCPVNICSSTFDSQFTMEKDSFVWEGLLNGLCTARTFINITVSGFV